MADVEERSSAGTARPENHVSFADCNSNKDPDANLIVKQLCLDAWIIIEGFIHVVYPMLMLCMVGKDS